MPNITFSDFTLEASPSLTDYLVGYRTAISGGERRTTIQSLSGLLGTGYFGSLTANRVLLGQGNGTLAASDLSYSTPTLSVPDSFNISSAGSISLTASGSNKGLTFSPTGTASVLISKNSTPTATFVGAGVVLTGADGQTPTYAVQAWGAAGMGLGFEAIYANGTRSLPTAVADGDKLLVLRGGGYDGTSFLSTRGYIEINSTGAWSTGSRPTSVVIGTTPPGQTSTSLFATFGGATTFKVGGTNMSVPAWGMTGVISSHAGATFTDTSSSGVVAAAVGHSFGRPTIAASSATTYTNAATLYISNPPTVSGGNATITNAWAMWVDAGNARFDGDIRLGSETGAVISDGSGAFSLTGGAGNMTITAGTGASRTLTLRTTTSGGTATTALSISSTQQVTVSQPSVGVAAFSIVTAATNDDPTETVYQNRSATTDATVTTIQTVAVPASTSLGFSGYVVSRRTGGASGSTDDGAFYRVEFVAKNTGGTAAIIGSSVTVIGESQAGWDVTLTASTSNILVQVTGASGNNVTWHLTGRYYPVST